MADQNAKFPSNPVFSCDECGKTCANQGGLTNHKNSLGAHEGLRRNEKNEIEFVCNVCDKVFVYQTSLYTHKRNKHYANVDAPAESTGEKTESTATTKVEDFYESDGRLCNEISHEKERVVEISSSMALGNVQDAVKRAFRNLVDEMIPLYVASGVEQMDAWYRVRAIVDSFENGLLMTLVQDTFQIADKLKRDLEEAATTDEPIKKRPMKESDWNAPL